MATGVGIHCRSLFVLHSIPHSRHRFSGIGHMAKVTVLSAATAAVQQIAFSRYGAGEGGSPDLDWNGTASG